MNILGEWQKEIAEYDEGRKQGKARVKNPSWQSMARVLLPIAEAAVELRADMPFNDENGKCLMCGTAPDKPHNYDCAVKSLFDALDEVEA